MKKNIAITGCTGCGKSTVSSIVREFGYDVFDVDKLSKTLLYQSDKVLNKLKKIVPKNCIENKVNLKKIGNYFEKNPYDEEKFNIWYQKYIGYEIRKIIKESKQEIVFWDIPLLDKMNIEELFDVIWVVEAKEESCFNRIKLRNQYEDLKILNLILRSKSCYENIQEKVIYIDNNGDICDLRRLIKKKLFEIQV